MAVIQTPSGRVSVRDQDIRPTDKVVPRITVSGGGGRGGSGGGGMSTRESPTPSAEKLFGSAEQKEEQIEAFRSGGEQALQQKVTQAKEAQNRADKLAEVTAGKAQQQVLRDLSGVGGLGLTSKQEQLRFEELNKRILKGQVSDAELKRLRDVGLLQPERKIEKKVIDTVNGVPITKLFITENGVERPATFAEEKEFRGGFKDEVIGTSKSPLILQAKDIDILGTISGKAPIGLQAQTFVEQKAQKFFSSVGGKVASVLPKSLGKLEQVKVKFSFTNQLKWLFFAPAFQTAVTKKGKVKVKVKQTGKGKVSIKQVTKSFEDEWIKGNKEIIRTRLKSLANAIVKQKDPELKAVAVENMKNLLTELRNSNIIQDFTINEATGSFAIGDIVGGSTTPIIKFDISEVLRTLENVPQLKATGVLGSGASALTGGENIFIKSTLTKTDTSPFSPSIFQGKGKFEKTDEVSSLLGFDTTLLSSTSLTSKQQVKQQPLQVNRLGLSLNQLSKQQTGQLNKQRSLQKNLQLSGLTTSQVTKQQSKQKLQQKTKQQLRQKTKQQQRMKISKTGKGGLILPSTGGGVLEELDIPTPTTQQGYYAEVKEKGKWLRVLNKVLVRKEALALGGYTTDNSTSAQFRVSKTKKKPTEGVVKGSFNRAKFRDFMIKNKKRVQMKDQYIEKRTNRIDTFGEKKQLSLAKLKKTKGFKALTKKKKKKGKKKRVTDRSFLLGGGFNF